MFEVFQTKKNVDNVNFKRLICEISQKISFKFQTA